MPLLVPQRSADKQQVPVHVAEVAAMSCSGTRVVHKRFIPLETTVHSLGDIGAASKTHALL
jgi:hypothetical protein